MHTRRIRLLSLIWIQLEVASSLKHTQTRNSVMELFTHRRPDAGHKAEIQKNLNCWISTRRANESREKCSWKFSVEYNIWLMPLSHIYSMRSQNYCVSIAMPDDFQLSGCASCELIQSQVEFVRHLLLQFIPVVVSQNPVYMWFSCEHLIGNDISFIESLKIWIFIPNSLCRVCWLIWMKTKTEQYCRVNSQTVLHF